jgi:hypothetical protein
MSSVLRPSLPRPGHGPAPKLGDDGGAAVLYRWLAADNGCTPPLTDGDLEVLDATTVLGVLGALQGKGDSLGRGASGSFNGGLPPPGNARFVDVEMPGPKLLIQVELHRNACLCAHGLMLQQVLQLVERQAEVLGHLAQLPIAHLNPIVISESCRSILDPEDDMRTALAKLDESTE